MSEVEELRRLGQEVVTTWGRWGRCIDEFPPNEYPSACGEWLDALDVAVLKLSAALSDHAFERARAGTGRSVAGSIAAMMLVDSLKAGREIEVPALGITLTRKDLSE